MKPANQELKAAIKPGCRMMTLEQVVKKLTAEKALLTAELKAMQPDSLFNANGWEVINREQELHTTLSVLERLANLPLQIQEPTH